MRDRCLPLFLRPLIILCFAFYCLTGVTFLDRSRCSWDIKYRGVHVPKGDFFKAVLLHVLDESRTDEGRNGLKVLGCIGISRMPNHVISFQMHVWLDSTLSRYWFNSFGFFFFFLFSAETPKGNSSARRRYLERAPSPRLAELHVSPGPQVLCEHLHKW